MEPDTAARELKVIRQLMERPVRYSTQSGLAGILSHSADYLLEGLGKRRGLALELLFRLVNVDPEGRRHTRQRIPLAEAIAVAGGGDTGQAVVNRLAGERARDGGRAQGPLRLITVSEEAASSDEAKPNGRWVNLIHETLIRSKGRDEKGRPQAYWPALWDYIEANKQRAARRERLKLQAREWSERSGPSRLLGLAGWGSVCSACAGWRRQGAQRGVTCAGAGAVPWRRWSYCWQ